MGKHFFAYLKLITKALSRPRAEHLTDANAAMRLSQAKKGFKVVQQFIENLTSAGQTVSVLVAGNTSTVEFYAGQSGNYGGVDYLIWHRADRLFRLKMTAPRWPD